MRLANGADNVELCPVSRSFLGFYAAFYRRYKQFGIISMWNFGHLCACTQTSDFPQDRLPALIRSLSSDSKFVMQLLCVAASLRMPFPGYSASKYFGR